jgi:glutamate 5-kinase
MKKNRDDPRTLVTTSRRIVIKVGSSVLTMTDGLNTRRIGLLVRQMCNMIEIGKEIVLVSSGAIAAGFKRVGLKEKPRIIQKAQACAAVGQARLIMAYEKSFERRGHKVAQILLTANDLFHRHRYINAKNTLNELLDWRIIPIINENDTVTVSEIKFGDNDTLGGMITGLVEADLFINLTDIEGLYDRDPRNDPHAVFQSTIHPQDDGVAAMAGKIPGSLGAGGMYTKVVAARRLARQGVPSIIANGKKTRILERILAGEPVGTLFLPRSEPMSQRHDRSPSLRHYRG